MQPARTPFLACGSVLRAERTLVAVMLSTIIVRPISQPGT
jgi:hypothetical protein